MDPEPFPNAILKISGKITPTISAKSEFWAPTWPLIGMGGLEFHFFSYFSSLEYSLGPGWPESPSQELLGLPEPHFVINLDFPKQSVAEEGLLLGF